MITCFKKFATAPQLRYIKLLPLQIAIVSAIVSLSAQGQPSSEIRPAWIQTCTLGGPSTLEGYEPLDYQAYLDLPDTAISRVTSALEETFIIKLVQQELPAPLSKTYCQIGVTRMVVDITYAPQDDSVAYVSMRAIYKWVTIGDRVGWQISELGEKLICARGRDLSSQLCL